MKQFSVFFAMVFSLSLFACGSAQVGDGTSPELAAENSTGAYLLLNSAGVLAPAADVNDVLQMYPGTLYCNGGFQVMTDVSGADEAQKECDHICEGFGGCAGWNIDYTNE